MRDDRRKTAKGEHNRQEKKVVKKQWKQKKGEKGKVKEGKLVADQGFP